MMKKLQISILVIIACVIMAITDSVIQPGYVLKSVIKAALFLFVPLGFACFNKEAYLKKLFVPDKKGIAVAVLSGLAVYAVVLGGYFTFRSIFDFSALTQSLEKTTGVNATNFIWVAVYISFVNSFLEEFFFRGFSFILLKRYTSKRFAYLFSSILFALYHIAMMLGWFGVPVILISLLGLFVGGLVFNRLDERNGNIYLSWLVHMFANFATNTIGFILFAE